MEKISKLPFKYEELNASQFVKAVKQSQETCVLPFGVLEKHGPHLPLGTDLINVRELVYRAAKIEYFLVYPEYYFGQIFEAKHQPGTIAYSHETIWNLLQETCEELARNGLKKIIIVNGHGGNNNFLKYFCQVQLHQKKDYIIHLFLAGIDEATEKKMKKLRKTDFDGHAGEVETSVMLTHHPDLVKPNNTGNESGKDQNRLKHIKHNFTGIWWYAKFPNHYAGDAKYILKEIGELELKSKSVQLIEMIKSIKKDQTSIALQNKFFEQSRDPLNTKQ
jgi:creatinine amidohydrolase